MLAEEMITQVKRALFIQKNQEQEKIPISHGIQSDGMQIQGIGEPAYIKKPYYQMISLQDKK